MSLHNNQHGNIPCVMVQLTFQSRLALTYAKERLRHRLAPEQQEKHRALSGRSALVSWWRWWWW